MHRKTRHANFRAKRDNLRGCHTALLNGRCAGRNAPGRSKVVRGVQSPIKMALMITDHEAIVIHCERQGISLNALRVVVL
jgi:hypothetical protein